MLAHSLPLPFPPLARISSRAVGFARSAYRHTNAPANEPFQLDPASAAAGPPATDVGYDVRQDLAATLVLENRDAWDGRHDGALVPASEALEDSNAAVARSL